MSRHPPRQIHAHAHAAPRHATPRHTTPVVTPRPASPCPLGCTDAYKKRNPTLARCSFLKANTACVSATTYPCKPTGWCGYFKDRGNFPVRLVIDDFTVQGVYLNGIYDLYPKRFNQAPVYSSFSNNGAWFGQVWLWHLSSTNKWYISNCSPFICLPPGATTLSHFMTTYIWKTIDRHDGLCPPYQAGKQNIVCYSRFRGGDNYG